MRDEILPAMENGFTTERHPDYAIRAFSDDVSESQGIVLMQVEDSSIARVRDVRTVGGDTAVFIGRSARMERYEEAAAALSDGLCG